jgi:hypothetical protein
MIRLGAMELKEYRFYNFIGKYYLYFSYNKANDWSARLSSTNFFGSFNEPLFPEIRVNLGYPATFDGSQTRQLLMPKGRIFIIYCLSDLLVRLAIPLNFVAENYFIL